ncbi:MAG: PaaI family thioesterase [Burkholderiales bacterium]|nr:PaaI family thioesterase [Burkholderiales bacterium]
MDVEACQAVLRDMFAPWVQALGLIVETAAPGEVRVRLPHSEALARVGGTVCGQALMSAADTAMVLAISTQLGGFRPMATVSQNTSFMRAISGTDVLVLARVLKPGRTLVFGEVEIRGALEDRLAVHATTTYALA